MESKTFPFRSKSAGRGLRCTGVTEWSSQQLECSSVSFAKVLPLAFVMIAGPQVLSAIFLATTERWQRNSAAYVTGAALSITATVTAAYFLSTGATGKGSSDDTVYIVVIVLLVFAGIHTFLTRKTAEPPKWMGKLQSATPRQSFRLGFLLLGLFPGDIATSVAVGAYLSTQGEPWWHVLPFLALTLLFLGLPAILVLVLGQRAQTLLPKVRDWMNNNSWVISEIVVVLFILIAANSLKG
jgi:hypothetical protein